MALQTYIPKRFNSKSRGLLTHIIQIVADYAADGFDLSVRQLFYQLVSRNLIPNTQKEYKCIVSLVTDARLAGQIDWEAITDRGRNSLRHRHWANPGEMAREMARNFRIDKWADQPCYVEVMVEKQALEGVLTPVCGELDITFTANKGYSSASAFHDTAKRFRRRHDQGKKLYALYLGDHDPSGLDMTRDVSERIPMLAGDCLEDGGVLVDGHVRGIPMTINRLALNIAQVREFNPPENPAKTQDSRYAGYMAQFGESSWELDAVEPRKLAQLVRDAVMAVRDEELWAAALTKESKMREELTKFAKKYEPKKRKQK
jgi:hypothetical protein